MAVNRLEECRESNPILDYLVLNIISKGFGVLEKREREGENRTDKMEYICLCR